MPKYDPQYYAYRIAVGLDYIMQRRVACQRVARHAK